MSGATQTRPFYFDKNGIKRTKRRSAAELKAERDTLNATCAAFEQRCREDGVL